MSDDDPVERLVGRTFDGEDDAERTGLAPETRDMEAELRERTGAGGTDTSELEVDSETATAFWAAVVYVNVGVLLLALGPTVYLLRGRPLLSAALPVAGGYALYRAYSVYRRFDARDRSDDESDGGEAD